MMKMKKFNFITMFLIIFAMVIFPKNIWAMTEEYYENENGVVFSKTAYDFFTEMYWDGYQLSMTQEDYDQFDELGVIGKEVETKTLTYPEEGTVPYGTFITTADRSLKIAKSCTTNCTLVVTFEWLQTPSIRSCDVIGAYLDGVSLVGTPSTKISVGNMSASITDLRKESNGIGSSFVLPIGNNIRITQLFVVTKGGHVYASYQHAFKSATIGISKDYTFSKTGYGRVFKFSDTSKSYYDQMSGVDIAV